MPNSSLKFAPNRARRADAGFSLPELMMAMAITLIVMSIVFALMRQNQNIFATETGVTAMNENVRAAVDLLTREVQAAGTGLRGMSAPILGVDSHGEVGDRLAILQGDPYAPVAHVRSTNGSTVATIISPPGAISDSGTLAYRDDRGRAKPLYKPGDRYVLYNDAHFTIVKVASTQPTISGDVVVSFGIDPSNPKSKFGDYRFNALTDSNGALLARLDVITFYRWDKETERLERRENDEPWADVARGIIGFQVRYRVTTDEQTLSEPLDEPPSDLEEIRSVVVTLRARTPDVEPQSPYYRETAERVEITPRNMRVVRSRGNDADDS
jgi:prepilin-type N-terminal cleavage/methylation domain-containing protein